MSRTYSQSPVFLHTARFDVRLNVFCDKAVPFSILMWFFRNRIFVHLEVGNWKISFFDVAFIEVD